MRPLYQSELETIRRFMPRIGLRLDAVQLDRLRIAVRFQGNFTIVALSFMHGTVPGLGAAKRRVDDNDDSTIGHTIALCRALEHLNYQLYGNGNVV